MGITRSTYVTGEVIENRAWTERLFSIRIRVGLMPFKAGQFVRLKLPIEGVDVARSYSLVNSPDEPDVEVFYSKVPNGLLSTALSTLQPGDTLEVSQPAVGFFVLDEIPDSKHLWMFATGTGVGPYISIMKTAEIWTRFEKVVLVYGMPRVNDLVYGDLIGMWQHKHSEQFRFVSCVTRESNPTGLEGRVTELLASGALEQRIGLEIRPEDSHVMLCGNHNMIDDMKDLLAERGMSKHLRRKPGHVTTEQYY